jgi:hypothetical protein
MENATSSQRAIEILRNECEEMGHKDASLHLRTYGIHFTQHSVGRLRKQHKIPWVNLKVASKWFDRTGKTATVDQLIARGLHPAYATKLIKER